MKQTQAQAFRAKVDGLPYSLLSKLCVSGVGHSVTVLSDHDDVHLAIQTMAREMGAIAVVSDLHHLKASFLAR